MTSCLTMNKRPHQNHIYFHRYLTIFSRFSQQQQSTSRAGQISLRPYDKCVSDQNMPINIWMHIYWVPIKRHCGGNDILWYCIMISLDRVMDEQIACWCIIFLTHWGRVMHICVSKQTIIGSDNGLSPDRRQAIIWTSAGILLIGPLGTNFGEIFI